MKTPSTANHSVASTKPNTGSNPMKSTKTSRSSKPAHILVGSILALALGATPAMGVGNAIWTGNGGDGLWSNMLNWQTSPGVWAGVDPTTNNLADRYHMTATATTTIDVNTSTWGTAGKYMYLGSGSVLNVPTGGLFGSQGNSQIHSLPGAVVNLTGGSLHADLRPATGNPYGTSARHGIYNISGGVFNASRFTYIQGGTLHIIGTGASLVESANFIRYWPTNKPGHEMILQYTLDSTGVRRLTTGTDYGSGDANNYGFVPMRVGGLATYLAGAMPQGETIDLYALTTAGVSVNRYGQNFEHAFKGMGLVDGNRGVVNLKGDRSGVVLRVKPIVWSGAGSDDNLQTAGNWGSAVVADKMLYFNGSTRLSPNNSTADMQVGGVQFLQNAGAFNLGGSKIRVSGDIINQSSNDQTISLAMDLTAANVSIDGVTRNLAITGNIGESGGIYGIAKRGVGTVTLSGNNTFSGKTTIGAGILSVASLNSVNGGIPLLPNSSLGAPTTVANGTIDLGSRNMPGQLTYTGTGEITDRVINLAGTTGNYITTTLGSPNSANLPGGGTLDQSGTGLLKFTSNLTATGGDSKTLLLQGSTAGTGEIAGAIINGSGTTSLAKAGTGMWTLSGASTYTGTTYVLAGTLGLNFSAATAPVTNIINNSANSSALTLNDGTLSLTGKASNINSQRFNGLTALAGSSAIALDANSATSLVLTLGALTRAAQGGGTVDFTLPTGTQNATNGVTTTSTTFLNNNVLTHAVNGTAFATVGGNDWATLNGTGNIVGYSSLHAYTTTTAAGTTAANYANFNIDADSSAGLLDGVITPNTLRFNSAAANTVTLAAGNNIIGAGGILVSSAVGSNASTITGGTLQGSTTGKDLVVIQNNPSDGLTIDSVIANNASTTSLTKSGPGTLTLGGSTANTYSGVTFANAGTLLLNKSGSAKAIADNGLTISPGATVQYTGTSTDMMGGGAVNIYGTGQLDFNGKTDTIGSVTITGIPHSNAVRPTANTTPVRNTAGGGNLTIGELIIYATPGYTTQLNSGSGTLTLSGNVTLGLTASGAGKAQISGNLALGGSTRTFQINSFGVGIDDMLVDAVVSGSGGLTKDGGGTLILSNANTYTGQTRINVGKLSINSISNYLAPSASAVGAPTTLANGTIAIGGGYESRWGGTLEYTGGAQITDRPISLVAATGGATLDQSGTGLLKFTTAFTAPGVASVDNRKTLTLQGSTSGIGEIAGTIPDSTLGTVGQRATSVTKTGTGTWDLNGNNTFTGPLTVDDGTLNVNGTLSTSLAVTVTDAIGGAPTKLRFGTVSQTLGSLTIGAGATVIFTSGLASGALTGDDGGSKAAGFGSPASSFGGGATVPEPGTLGLLLVGALGMLNRRRRA